MRCLHVIILFLSVLSASPGLCHAADRYIDGLPGTSKTISGFSVAEMRKEIASTPLHHIEGIWKLTSDGTEIAILRDRNQSDSDNNARAYRMILMRSANRALRPGTVIGLVSPTAKTGTYDARIYTKAIGPQLSAARKFTLKLDDNDSHLIFEMNKSAYSINLWRMLPYMFRYSVRKNNKQPSTAGCIRIFPAPELPSEPVYL